MLPSCHTHRACQCQAQQNELERTKILLPQKKVTLQHDSKVLAPIDEDLDTIDRTLLANRADPDLEDLRQQAQQREEPYPLESTGLVLHMGRVVVSAKNNLRTQVLKMIHESTSTAHPGRNIM
ncbi:hypothetical protein K3495_g17226 [Podosphaera aphanis]|nr:hypothetical protein K3495_g17226 [Podosphaera aphanis]